jgi:flagellar biosynthesis GTPase FlhF
MSNHEKASNLYVKSFFAASIPAAMEQAQEELGPDALLLNAREAPAEARHLGDFEVVFGASRETLAPEASVAPQEAAEPIISRNPSGSEPHVADSRRAVRRRPAARPLAHAGADTIRARSAERRARKRIAQGAVLNFAKRQEAPAPEPPSAPTADELASRFDVQPEIGRITVLVGPPGSGKTTTLVKLAVNECL